MPGQRAPTHQLPTRRTARRLGSSFRGLGAGAVRAAAPALALAALLAASVASAQVPRNGDEYGGKNHEPTQAEVSKRENAAGVAPSPGRANEDNRTVEQLGNQLLGAEQADPPRAANPPTTPLAAPDRR